MPPGNLVGLYYRVSDEPEAITDGANDVVVVEQPDGTLSSTEFHVQGQIVKIRCTGNRLKSTQVP